MIKHQKVRTKVSYSYPVMMEETSNRWSGWIERLTVTEKWSEGNKPSIVEIVCFIESLAAVETPIEITELSRGLIRRSMLAMTVKPLSKLELRVETTSSPSTWQDMIKRRWRERRRKKREGSWLGLGRCGQSDVLVRRERMKGWDEIVDAISNLMMMIMEEGIRRRRK